MDFDQIHDSLEELRLAFDKLHGSKATPQDDLPSIADEAEKNINLQNI